MRCIIVSRAMYDWEKVFCRRDMEQIADEVEKIGQNNLLDFYLHKYASFGIIEYS